MEHFTRAAAKEFGDRGISVMAIGPWIRFLVSEGWWMTGQTIRVNGGYTTK